MHSLCIAYKITEKNLYQYISSILLYMYEYLSLKPQILDLDYAWLLELSVSSVHSEFGSLYDLGLTPSLKYNTISNTSKALLSSKTLFQAPLTQCSNCCYTVLGDVPRAVSSKQAPPCLATTPREVEACSWFREPKHGTAG